MPSPGSHHKVAQRKPWGSGLLSQGLVWLYHLTLNLHFCLLCDKCDYRGNRVSTVFTTIFTNILIFSTSLTSESSLLLLLLSHFSHVWLCATPEMVAHQAPPALGFSRQEHWSGLSFPSPCVKVKSESEVTQSFPTCRDPMDFSPPGSSVRGIF